MPINISFTPFPSFSETQRIKEIQEKHDLLVSKSSEITPAEISQITGFLETLTQAGKVISSSEYRSQLRALIRYWASFVNDKTGSFPIAQLEPFDESRKFNTDAIAEAIVTTIDGISQRKNQLEKAELENQMKEQQIKQEIQMKEQQIKQEMQLQQLELERQKLELEKQRLYLQEQDLELQKKAMQYALEIAKKTVDLLYPTADDTTKAMMTQTLLPSILQLSNSNGLELILPIAEDKEK